jgi:hypothetical protein
MYIKVWFKPIFLLFLGGLEGTSGPQNNVSLGPTVPKGFE